MPDGNFFDQFDAGAASGNLDSDIHDAAQRNGVDPTLYHSLIMHESGGNQYAVSPQGAAGYAQLEPETAASLGVTDLFDKNQNLDAGAKYLRQGLDRYGNRPDLALAYYHGGPDTQQWGPKTAAYSDAVMDAYRAKKAEKPAAGNYFDKFDAKPQGGNYFDKFDPQPAAPGAPSYTEPPVNRIWEGDTGTPLNNRQAVQQLPPAKTEAAAPIASQIPAGTLGDVLSSPKALAADMPQSQGPNPALAAIGQKIKEAWQNSPTILTPQAQGWLDRTGLGGVTRLADIAMAAPNAVFAGGLEAAAQTAGAIGGQKLAGGVRELGEYAMMTGIPELTMAPHPHEGAPEPAPVSTTPTLDAMASETKATRTPIGPEAMAAAEESAPTEPAPRPRTPEQAAIDEAASEEPAPAEQAAVSTLQDISEGKPAAETVAPHPAPDNSGAMTNLSDADYTQLMVEREKEEAPVEAPQVELGENMMKTSGEVGDNVALPEAEPQAETPTKAASPAISARRTTTPFEVTPKEPERLASFVRRQGGMQDTGGDVRSTLGGAKYRPGLINKKGLPDDDMAQRAWDAGYFQDSPTRPDINALKDALAEDLRGNPRYSMGDLEDVDRYHAALERNTEMDRLATEHDIPTLGITREQFYDTLADRMSVEDQAREIAEQEAALPDAVQRMRSESAADLREYYGQSQARSLKDMEKEYAQSHEQATPVAAVEQRPAGAEGRGEVSAGEAGGEGSAGPSGTAAGIARGTGAESQATDLLGRPVTEPRAKAQPEPTIHNDQRQITMPGAEPSAIQAQAARDAQGRGALQSDVTQKLADEGLFAPDTSGQGSIFANPEIPTEPSLLDLAKAVIADRKGGNRQTALKLETTAPQYEVTQQMKGLRKAIKQIQAGFAPTSMRGAKPMEFMLRRHNAESAQAYDRAAHALDKVRLATDRLSAQAQIEFTDRMEHGEAQPTPELQAVADTLRAQLDGWAKQIQGLGKGYLANAVENYMGHIWGNYAEWASGQPADHPQSEMQAIATARNVRRQPLRGSGAFLKKRSFPTQLEGIEAGLQPVTLNPVDLQLIKLHEMQKFYHGTALGEQMKENRLATWVPATAEDERDAQLAGWQKLDDTIFRPRIMGENNAAGFGRLEPGNYWAPEPIARVFNNYMSQGWHGKVAVYDGLRSANNALNTLQLGLSGFHAAFVTADTAISKAALGLQQIAAGHPIKGAGNILSGSFIAPAMARTVWRGSQLRRAWLEPENASPEMRQIVEALKTGGGRVSMPRFFQTSASGTFFRNLSDLKNPQSAFYQAAQMFRDAQSPAEKAVMVPLRIAGRLIDTINEPLMGQLVPRAKLGVFADMAQNWLKDHPTASREEVADAMTKFQDSVDNRLGQLNYDNLFWNKVAKDIAFVTTRSVGWNLGTVREIGGAFVDSGSAIKAIANGKAPSFSTRMAYTIAMPVITAEIGAVMTYLATGQSPQSMLDYFYPPTGGQDEGGTPDRRMIPGYMKDVIAFWKDPVQTALNKTAPVLETIQELVKNRDYYGGIIYDPERDRGPAQAYGDYLLNQANPFSVRSLVRLRAEGAPALDQAMGFWGFQPAPKSITQPERAESFQRKENLKAYRRRIKEPGHMNFLNAPPSP